MSRRRAAAGVDFLCWSVARIDGGGGRRRGDGGGDEGASDAAAAAGVVEVRA